MIFVRCWVVVDTDNPCSEPGEEEIEKRGKWVMGVWRRRRKLVVFYYS